MTSKFKKGCLWGAASGTALICALAASGSAHASGYQIREVSGTLQGSSFAGMSTASTDASTIFYNPAKVGQFDETSYSVGGSLIVPRSEMKNGSATAVAGQDVSRTDYGDFAQDAFVPNAHAIWKLNDNLNFGVSITAPWGLVTDYEDDFSGRFFGTTSSIKTTNVKPVIAYRFDNGLSVGGGLQLQYMDARLARAVVTGAGTEGSSDVTGNDFAPGWTLGLNWDVTPTTRIGVGYTSEVKHELEGDIKFTNAAIFRDQTATANVTTPEFVNFGIAQDLSDKWTIMADAQWTNWNALDNLTFNYGGDITLAAGDVTSSSEPYKWGSAWFGSIGARYQHDENWAFTGGIAFDETPVKDEYRTVRLPDSNRYWVSLGTTYKAAEWADVTLGYTHIFAHSADVNQSSDTQGTFSGTYESHVDIIALQANFKF